jgi:hypothetical protein
MTPEEETELQAIGNEVTAALQSPWEPRCVATAFATHMGGDVSFTMQMWIDLELFRSPLLQGLLPESFDEAKANADAFGLEPATAEDAVIVMHVLRDTIQRAFDMALPMEPPSADDATALDQSADGFGQWLPLYAFLVGQAAMSPSEAKAMEVGEAYALMAAIRRNQGWHATGTAYALRGIEIAEDAP